MQEKTVVEDSLNLISSLETDYEDALTFYELGEIDGDQATCDEAEKVLIQVKQRAARQQIASLLSGESDNNDCFIEVNAGAGGTEAQDWAQMILRMYLRWAEDHNYKIQWIDESTGEEAGIKSATVKVQGPKAFGWLKTESGIHRLVRISPFDSNSRRHTSFASVWVYPEIDDNIVIEVNESELRIDTYRASGAGGQHINKTDSAVRLTHIATGIVVQCQNDRSQHRNKAQAMKMMKSRLYELEMRKREEVAQAVESSKSEIGWGHQIRSYVLHPYQMVKDVRTAYEKGNAQGVLDGDLDGFLEAALSHKIGAKE
ncbi:prfB [Symbiodinium sp. KB8]|nr:prfB [Symbiodinium sp. KB8]